MVSTFLMEIWVNLSADFDYEQPLISGLGARRQWEGKWQAMRCFEEKQKGRQKAGRAKKAQDQRKSKSESNARAPCCKARCERLLRARHAIIHLPVIDDISQRVSQVMFMHCHQSDMQGIAPASLVLAR